MLLIHDVFINVNKHVMATFWPFFKVSGKCCVREKPIIAFGEFFKLSYFVSRLYIFFTIKQINQYSFDLVKSLVTLYQGTVWTTGLSFCNALRNGNSANTISYKKVNACICFVFCSFNALGEVSAQTCLHQSRARIFGPLSIQNSWRQPLKP